MRRIPAQRRAFRVQDASLVAPGVRMLTLETSDGAPYDHLAGQWIKLYLPGGIDRDYSIASAPASRGGGARIELLVTLVEGGAGSRALHDVAIGAEISTLGPSGLFVREDAELEAPALFVGTGTGVAPLRAMLEAIPATHPSTLLFGVRTPADLMFDAAWRERALSGAFHFEPTLSRAPSDWVGRRGYVQTHLRELLLAMPASTHVYVCGLTKMITEVRRTLKEDLGIDRRRVHSERYD